LNSIFVSVSGKIRERWREAFSNVVVVSELAMIGDEELIWLDISNMNLELIDLALEDFSSKGRSIVVLSPMPNEAEAAHVMGLGARGYLHVLAAAKTLREVEAVVAKGGAWLEPGLMARLLKITEAIVGGHSTDSVDLSMLTSREFAVAEQVARGSSNREIAASLDISERTVKAHLTAIFEKLNVRDRVQLAISVLKGLSSASVT
jgi:two-component system nitrate/nitrite response regulator NarL